MRNWKAGRCHRIGQGWQKPQYAAAQAQSQLSLSSSHPVPPRIAAELELKKNAGSKIAAPA
jgi:hypothetical protein